MQNTFIKTILNFWKYLSNTKSFSDTCVALAWAIFVGLPLFTLHMVVLDYEHYLHGMTLQFSLAMSFKNMFPYHPISVGLWMVVVFIAAFSVKRAFRNQRELVAMKSIVDRAQNEAITDSLTGVLNRRAFDTMMKSTLEFSKFADQPFTVAIVDIDKFKSINDRQGHVTGDKALCAVAKHLKKLVRAQDIVTRYGGDEFAIICPGLSQDGARGMANRLKSISPHLGIGWSVGIATYPGNGQNITEIIEFADQELYREKEIHHSLLMNLEKKT